MCTVDCRVYTGQIWRCFHIADATMRHHREMTIHSMFLLALARGLFWLLGPPRPKERLVVEAQRRGDQEKDFWKEEEKGPFSFMARRWKDPLMFFLPSSSYCTFISSIYISQRPHSSPSFWADSLSISLRGTAPLKRGDLGTKRKNPSRHT